MYTFLVPIILDASVACALAIGERPAPRVSAIAAQLFAAPPLVPACFPAELEKALFAAVRAKRLSAERAREAVQAMLARVEVRPQPEPAPFLQNHGLTANDETYLALAVAEGAALATLDRKLAKAARKEGVRVLP
jgi:predicted nucleic acid-binding protein